MSKNTVDDCGLPAATRLAALIVTGLDGIESTAAELAGALQISCDVASTRAAALRLLDRRVYAVVMVDQMLADSDPEGIELIWKAASLAIPLQVNFALAGSGRVEREVRAALRRRLKEAQLAAAAAAAALDAELKNAVTGMLLESELALAETGVPPAVQARLRALAGIASGLRERLTTPPKRPTTLAGLPLARG
jgi:hypothetical protein